MSFDHRKNRVDDPAGLDDSLADIQRRRILAVLALLFAGAAVIGFLIFNLRNAISQDPLDKEMVSQGRVIEHAVTSYYREHAEFPGSLDEVVMFFPADGVWPIEPYNSTTIHDNGSAEFSAPASIGMVHYERIAGGEKAGYRLHVFGRKGMLITLVGGYIEER